MSFGNYLKNEIHKQHINLSYSTWDTIENDIQSFYEKNSSKANISNFLNRIFKYYREESLAAVTNRLNEKRDFYLQTLKPKLSETTKLINVDEIIDALIESKENELKEKLLNYPKGEGRKFRITNENYDFLIELPESSKECIIFKKPGKYLKAIFETYAELPYIEREKIFFSEIIDKINDAIEMRKILRITHNNNKVVIIKPYKLLIDRLSNFNYLAGLVPVAETGDKICEKCVSFRISRINDISRTYKNFNMEEHIKKEFEKQIQKKGVQFLVDDLTEIHVKLSNSGIWKYNTQLNLRPDYIRIENDNIYVFNCTERQIEYYFFKFGRDAIILTPSTLRNKFHHMYSDAEKIYR